MIEVQIFIPLAVNSGADFTADHHLVFEMNVMSVFGGITGLPGTVDGSWMDDGTVYHDEIRAYVVALKSITQGGQLGGVVKRTLSHRSRAARLLVPQLATLVRSGSWTP